MLVAPLDWGLGHSTRCIPIIKHLLNYGCSVIIGSEGAQKKLLELEFPQLLFIPLKGYRIHYAKSKRLLLIKILCQLPKILFSVKKEHSWLQKAVIEHSIDAIISDNRFGLWHHSIPSIFLTHQLQIKGPSKWVEMLLRKVNYHHINRFTACWIPDFEGVPNLAGALSHPTILPKIPVKYLGALSRLAVQAPFQSPYDLLIIISGPEPQRTLLEDKLLAQLKNFKGSTLIVRGLPGSNQKIDSFNNVRIENHLNLAELERVFNECRYIISRAGYTTVMDIVKLRKKAILVPTPGQTEQEYLAVHLQNQQICIAFEQDKFNLEHALQKASTFNYQLPAFTMDAYKEVVDNFLHSLRT